MAENIEGKVALLTGALGGIGREMVKALLRNKIKGIALLDLQSTANAAESFQAEINQEFGAGKTIFIPTDATSTEQLKAAYETTISHFGNLDIVINNAGIFDFVSFEKTMDLNLMGVMRSMYLALETYLPKHRSGKEAFIVNTASTFGLAPIAACASYCISKYAVVGMSMTYGTKLYYDQYGVNVLTICPGFTTTPLINGIEQYDFGDHALNKACMSNHQKPECVGEALIVALKSGENGSIWLTQHSKPVEKVDMNEVLKPLREKTGMIPN